MPDSRLWLRVAALSQLPDDAALPVRLGDVPIALYRLNGHVHAIDDVCTHEFALLSQGFVEDGAIECPLHQARFDIATGRCLAPPATTDLRRYAVRIEGDDIYVCAAPQGA
ncbi:MAG TPA: non-heme iron oxygenase ferredoxin subunit [Xanthobacteraceae bacterium]|jgi:3-phenylpropionate/trans-cinnamate dioxygenase ferredoxin subunit|nr:non-heme iron oxygenase ferredoxin subunit [Xanthobacteraceae bacterium]